MNTPLEPSWQTVLANEFKKEYFQTLTTQVTAAYASDAEVYPSETLIFHAFKHCPFDTVKVVILGQDPYHGVGQANGLAFSVPDGTPIPPSLRNIYKEISSDIGTAPPESGNLERWADQGVLLLNSTLTVRAGEAGSHQSFGWEQFTDAVIQTIADKKERVVFMLWGKFAESKAAYIDESRHLILKAPHPSPLSAHRGFFGCQHFSQCNAYLVKRGLTPIKW
jgi:uracil-DNA glycosylase